jgi:hypothetical protein
MPGRKGSKASPVKTEFLIIRVSAADRERMAKAAQADHLDVSTWARRTLLRTIEGLEPSTDANS